MIREQTVQFLELLDVHVPAHQTRTGWVVASCPLASWRHRGGKDKNPSFAIRIEQGDGFCNCFSCGFHGTQSDLVLEMRARNKKAPVDSFTFGQAMQLIAQAEEEFDLTLDGPDFGDLLYGDEVELHEFPDWWLESFPKWFESEIARVYLGLRGVGFQVANMLQLRFDTEQKRVCFPVRDFKGRLMGLHGRAVLDGAEPRYRMYTYQKRNNPLVWLGEERVDFAKPIVVVEGPLDLASVYRVYRNVVSPLFSNPSVAKLKRMVDAYEWITLLDRGTGGDAGRARIDQVLTKPHAVRHLLPPQAFKDPGEMPLETLVEVLHNHVAFDDFLIA